MSHSELLRCAAAFGEWADAGLAAGVPDIAVAFSFNLYEHEKSFAIEVIGSPHYDPDNPDRACHEVYAYRDPLFEVPHAVVGSEWEQGLAVVIDMVRGYLRGCTPEHRLRLSDAVAVGFVDGDLHVVWADGVERAEPP